MIALPGIPILMPNLWLYRIRLKYIIWQFESKTSITPDGYVKAIYYDGTEVEGKFSKGKTIEGEIYKVKYTDGTSYTGELKDGEF